MFKTLTTAFIALHVVSSAAHSTDRQITLEELYEAFGTGNLETVMAFKAKDLGTDFVFYGPRGATLLHSAAQSDQPEIATALIADGLPVDIRTKSKAATPLMIAASHCGTRTGIALLDAGAEVNAIHKSTGGTALIFAAWDNCPEMVSLLLDAGADPMIAARGRKVPNDERGLMAVDFARKHNPALLETRAGKRLVARTEAGEGCDGARVEAGDTTLEILAERVLGEAKRWRNIAKLNGLGPGKGYRLGDCLKLPV
ncbi:MAG: ankyrin repeat domain-containing protein [Boseongicola sp. SB0677_bin_26]|nr:ankyrin repeat domain-containing protein [Boseongicola sp. SB0677_bin_26]